MKFLNQNKIVVESEVLNHVISNSLFRAFSQ